MTHHTRVRVFLALFCVVAMSACVTTVRKAPEYSQRMRGIHKIGLMPPGASATLIVFQGDNQEIPEVVTRVREELVSSATSQIRQFDYLVDRVNIDAPEPAPTTSVAELKTLMTEPASESETPSVDAAPIEKVTLETLAPEPVSPPTEAEIAADDELRFAATQVQRAAEQAFNEMFETPEIWKSEAYNYKRSLGPEINQFADMVDAEALFFVRYSYFSKSGGEIAKDIAVTVLLAAATLGNATVVQPVTVATIEVCLVDGATGDVLFANVAAAQEMIGDPDTARLMRSAFRGFNPRDR